MTPNRLETRRATGREVATIDDAIAAGRRLCAEFELDHAFVTLDSDGIVVRQADGPAEHLPTRQRQVYDITGAGDMVLAMLGMALAAGSSRSTGCGWPTSPAVWKSRRSASSRQARRDPARPVLTGERTTVDKICTLDVLERHVAARRRLGQRIVLHQRLLRRAARPATSLPAAGRPQKGTAGRRPQQRRQRAPARQGARSADLRPSSSGRRCWPRWKRSIT